LKRRTKNANRTRAELLILVVGYLCLVDLVGNIVTRLGWIHVRLPGLNGFFSTIWKAALATALCFVLAWYIDRQPGRRAR
jgi:hypothetical protein